jgi:carbamoyltransferase
MPMRILGIVFHTHDAGVALLNDGVPEMIVEEERLNRQKKTLAFPQQALDAVFADRGLDINDVDVVTIPWNTFRLQKSFWGAVLGRMPRSLHLLRPSAYPAQEAPLVFGPRYFAYRLRRHFKTRRVPPVISVGHHDSHAASAFFCSPFEEATVLIMDGYGDNASTSVYLGRGNRLETLWHTPLLNSLGAIYTAVTMYLGFRGNHDEGSVMGLAAYGEPRYSRLFRDLVHLNGDGLYQVNYDYFGYQYYGMRCPWGRRFVERFGPPRRHDEPLTQHHRDIAFALQSVIEETILHMVRYLTKELGTRTLCLAGGVALNCVSNARILSDTDVERIWIPPNPSDTGAVLGSAMWHYHQTRNRPRAFEMRHSYYGCEYSDEEVETALRDAGMSWRRMDEATLLRQVATDLAAGKIVGWFQGRFENGPRALGNRSILADPRRAEMKDVMNAKVKHRESFRPFAPAVKVERCSEFFQIDQPDPFMTIAPYVRDGKGLLIPAVVHADRTARIQTVDREANPRFYDLLCEFERLTSIPILINTSFNRQEPIVARPSEAISCFLRTTMDVLVLGNHYTDDRNEEAVRRARERFAPPQPAWL